jgi:hypothetical protein
VNFLGWGFISSLFFIDKFNENQNFDFFENISNDKRQFYKMLTNGWPEW